MPIGDKVCGEELYFPLRFQPSSGTNNITVTIHCSKRIHSG